MMRRVRKFLITIVLLLSIFFFTPKINAKTLAELREELARDKANLNKTEAQKKTAAANIAKYNAEIVESAENVDKFENEIAESKAEIVRLGDEIKVKNEEIAELLRFLQASSGTNVYLEYIFGASDFADFIYRSAVVEQLTDYNDNLIKEMYDLIEENKLLQEKLADKIVKEEEAIKKYHALLKSLDLQADALDEEQKDMKAEVKAGEEEIAYYTAIGCKENEDITACVSVPYASGFTRPTTRGYISSNYGYRMHPTLKVKKLHAGIDIALSQGNNVYASAAGYVSKLVKKSSCGGNMVYLKHNIGGVKYTTVYMHLLSFNVKVGDTVTINTIIAKSGGGSSTQKYDKCTTGSHLHFGVYKGWDGGRTSVNPRNYVSFPAKGKSYSSRW